MATLLFQGHASCRITTRAGAVIYIDPFAGEGYDLPAATATPAPDASGADSGSSEPFCSGGRTGSEALQS